jgi:hypothetical protein
MRVLIAPDREMMNSESSRADLQLSRSVYFLFMALRFFYALLLC